MIQSFSCRETQAIFEGRRSKKYGNIKTAIERKLAMLDAAADVLDLRVPPNNRLEELKGDRKGQHSIRVNDQFRICFVWTAQGPANVEVVDYH